MTFSIENGEFVSRTFQKKMSLHLYIPPSSEHPSSCIKGTIFSFISNKYFRQITYQKDFVYFAGLLYYRTLQRGWDRDLIHKLTLEATRRAENTNPRPPSLPEDNKDTVFLHFEFHKDGISRLQLRAAYDEHYLSSIFKTQKSTLTELSWPSPRQRT